jgi:hypothetical protein
MVVTAPLQRVWGTPLTELAHLMSLFLMAPTQRGGFGNGVFRAVFQRTGLSQARLGMVDPFKETRRSHCLWSAPNLESRGAYSTP